MNAILTTELAISDATAAHMRDLLDEWQTDPAGKRLVLGPGVTLHDLDTGRSYGGSRPIIVRLPGWAVAMGFALGAAFTALISLLA